MKNKLTLSFAALSFLTLTVQADTTIHLENITVSASPIHEHEAFDVPAQIDALTSDTIAKKGSASLGKILEDIPGVNSISTGSQAGKPVIRGMTGERVKVVSNGSATDSQTYGIRHVNNIDPFLADRIEVIRGAQGVLYGSDALGGVVNVLSGDTLRAAEGTTLYDGVLSGEYNTNNNEWMSGIKARAAHGKFGVNIGVAMRQADNYKTPSHAVWNPGDTAGELPRFSGTLPFTNFENRSANIAFGYHDDWGNATLQHTYWQSFQNYLGHTSAPTFSAVSSAGQDLSNNETQLRAKLLAGQWLIKPSLSHTRNRREAAGNTPYEEMASKKGTNEYIDIDVDRTDAKLALVHPLLWMLDGEIGIEGYDKEQTLKSGKLAPSATEKGLALYLFEEADFEDFILQGGVRYDRRSIKAPLDGTNAQFSDIFDASNNTKDFSAFGGSLGLTYRVNETFNIATNIARGFRAPSIFELYAGGLHGGIQAYQLGNPNLKEETTLGGDIAFRYQDATTKTSLSFYQSIIKNYIFLENTGYRRNPTTGAQLPLGSTAGIPEMRNEQTDARMQGIEFAFETSLTKSTKLDGAFEIIKGKDTKNNRELPLLPAHNARAALHQNFGNFWKLHDNTLSIDFKYVASQKVGGNYEPFAQYNTMPFGSADTASYTLWGLGYASEFEGINDKKATLHIKVNNLFDKAYRDFLDTYKGYALGMGRNVMLSLQLPF